MMELWQAQPSPNHLRHIASSLIGLSIQASHLDLLGARGNPMPCPDKVQMHFDFSAAQILWTLTFAALLVLLVVLLGRDRARRFPFFTASILTMGMLLLMTQLLFSKLPRMTGTEIFLGLSDLDVLVSLLVLVELARRAFPGLGKVGWFIGTFLMLSVATSVLIKWGPWPAWKTLTATSEMVTIRILDLTVDKGILLAGVLTVELGILITLFGRRFGAGWRSHTQQIVIGLSTAAIGQIVLRASLQAIGNSHITTQADYDRVVGLREKLIHANNALFLCVLAWWIACLWIDEPGKIDDPGEASQGDPIQSDQSDESAVREEVAPGLEEEALPGGSGDALLAEAEADSGAESTGN
jgi:hypothetical protein